MLGLVWSEAGKALGNALEDGVQNFWVQANATVLLFKVFIIVNVLLHDLGWHVDASVHNRDCHGSIGNVTVERGVECVVKMLWHVEFILNVLIYKRREIKD